MVCVFWLVSYNSMLMEKYLSQLLHLYGFSPVWILWWTTRPKFKKHTYHINYIYMSSILGEIYHFIFTKLGFVIVATLILFLPRNDYLMIFQKNISKPFVTNTILLWFLLSKCFLVSYQIILLSKEFVTIIAFK